VKNLTEENFRLNEAYKQRQALTEFAIKSEIDLNKKIRDIQHDMATATMTEIEKKYSDITYAAEETARAAIEQENSRRRQLGLARMTANEEKQYRDAAVKGTKELMEAERAAYEQSRSFSTGWQQAFRDYVENATNAANVAKSIFQKATQGMEDMIVNFAKTGKFEFKSFVNSILEELLRSQIRQTMAQIFQIPGLGGGSNTGGSMFGSIGKLLGFANGGIIPTNAPVVVGERGPELLMGASGRQVIPNEQLGASTNVTYNINAVDARSFKDLIAQDPSFIHAVALQGAKSIPGRR
jgi:lambda family phage tail tape measure protein